MNNIQDIKNILNKNINNFNMKYIKRNRKIDFKDIIYGLSLKTIYNSYDKVVYEINKNNLNKNNLNKISKSGFIKKQNFINNLDLDNLNNDLLNYIYKNKYEKRVLAVDGSYLKTLSILNNDNLKFSSKKNNYISSIIGGLYDVDKKIIINYNHTTSVNERKNFEEQLKYVRKGDTLLFDRGYYSEYLINILNKNHINYLFRMKNNILCSKYIIKNNLNEYIYKDENKFFYKIVNYKINNKNDKEYKKEKNNTNKKEKKDKKIIDDEYYILTNLIDLNIDDIKNLYAKRWTIETHFKEAKYTTSLNEINSKNINNLLKEIRIHNLVYILYYYYYNCFKDKLNFKYEFNNKLSLEFFIRDILYILIYKKKYKKDIIKITDILPIIYRQRKNRHFIRESKRKVSIWYIKREKIIL